MLYLSVPAKSQPQSSSQAISAFVYLAAPTWCGVNIPPLLCTAPQAIIPWCALLRQALFPAAAAAGHWKATGGPQGHPPETPSCRMQAVHMPAGHPNTDCRITMWQQHAGCQAVFVQPGAPKVLCCRQGCDMLTAHSSLAPMLLPSLAAINTSATLGMAQQCATSQEITTLMLLAQQCSPPVTAFSAPQRPQPVHLQCHVSRRLSSLSPSTSRPTRSLHSSTITT